LASVAVTPPLQTGFGRDFDFVLALKNVQNLVSVYHVHFLSLTTRTLILLVPVAAFPQMNLMCQQFLATTTATLLKLRTLLRETNFNFYI
jgi:hypothetical protein